MSVSITPEGGSETAATNAPSYLASGIVCIVPTQGETNYSGFLVTAYKAGCIPASVTVVTTDSATAGRVNVASVAGTTQTARDLGAQLDAAVTTRAAAATALTNATWTDAKAGYLDAAITTRHASGAAVAKSPATLAAADVTGNLPADVKTYTVQPTVTGATLHADYDAAKTAASAANLATVVGYIDTEVAAVLTAVDTEVAAIKAKTDNLPASPAAVSDIPTAGAVADAVWDEALAGHAGAGSAGNALATASSGGVDPSVLADAICDEALVGHATPGTVGKALSDAAAQTTAAAVRAAVGLAAANLDTQLVAANNGTPPTAAAIASQVRTELGTELGRIDAAVSTRLPTATYAVPPTAVQVRQEMDANSVRLAAIDGKTANLPSDPADQSLVIAATDAVMSRIGANGAGLTALGDARLANLDAAVSTRLATAGYSAPPSAATVAGQVRTELAAELARVDAAVSTRATPAQVHAEVADVLTVDPQGEPAAVPAANASIASKLSWLFTLGRNKRTQTSTTAKVRNDADSADIASASVSDDGATFTHGEWS